MAIQTVDAADHTNSFHASGALGSYLDRYNRVIRHEWTRNAGAGTFQSFNRGMTKLVQKNELCFNLRSDSCGSATFINLVQQGFLKRNSRS